MGRQRKHYTDKFKYEAVKEALKAGANRAEIAVKYNVSPSCLSEWVESFIEGKFETEEQKSMRQKIAELEAKNELMLKELGKKQLEIDLLKKTRISGGALETRRFRTGGCKRSEAHSWGAVQNPWDLKDKRGYAWAGKLLTESFRICCATSSSGFRIR